MAINIHGPGAHSLLYSSVKDTVEMTLFSENQSWPFLFRKGLFFCDNAYITTMFSAAYRFHTALPSCDENTRIWVSCALYSSVLPALTQWEKAQMQIIGNILAFQRVFMGQIDGSGVSKRLLRNSTAIIGSK